MREKPLGKNNYPSSFFTKKPLFLQRDEENTRKFECGDILVNKRRHQRWLMFLVAAVN